MSQDRCCETMRATIKNNMVRESNLGIFSIGLLSIKCCPWCGTELKPLKSQLVENVAVAIFGGPKAPREIGEMYRAIPPDISRIMEENARAAIAAIRDAFLAEVTPQTQAYAAAVDFLDEALK